MLLPDVIYLSYFHYVCKHNLFVCTDVMMQTIASYTNVLLHYIVCNSAHCIILGNLDLWYNLLTLHVHQLSHSVYVAGCLFHMD